MESSGGIVETDGRFEMLAGVIVEDERGAAGRVVGLPQVINERPRESDGFAVSRELLVHEPFEIGFGDEGIFGGGRGKETVLHLV